MTNQEYKQKKRECLLDFCKEHCYELTPEVSSIFGYAFDRAYTLGKQEKDATMQQDYKSGELECWCDFCNTEIARRNSFDRALVKAANNFAFFRGYRFGKQEKDADTVIQGWVARDKDCDIFLYEHEPKRIYDGEYSRWEEDVVCTQPLPRELFPDLTWESDPEPVEIIIKRKKNG